ncbi:MAG: endonuclease/exonuclease/phosphatase family protein [Clostridia bacterium]|nr:endonuclease/exonuclease/phosphatase family protein [Clostridia bacterium]
MSTKLKIMSFNMRLDQAHDGNNHFSYRKGRIIEFINEAKADVIGFQEITPTMREWLVETFPDYYMVGVGRAADYSDETSLIAFRKDAMALVSCDTIMLSTSPRVFGSRYDGSDQSHCPREYVKALLKHRDISEPFYVYNVHTDHQGAVSRQLASTQIMQDITSHNKKFFMTGDFNAGPETPEIAMITQCATRAIKDTTQGLSGTYHNFGREQNPWKIDYIFTDADTTVLESVRVEDTPAPDTPYISDHNPIYIVVEL